MPATHDPLAFMTTFRLLMRENSWIFVGGEPQYRSENGHYWTLYGILGTDNVWDEASVKVEFSLWAEHQGWEMEGKHGLLPGNTEIGGHMV